MRSCSPWHYYSCTAWIYKDEDGNQVDPLTDADANEPGFQVDLAAGEQLSMHVLLEYRGVTLENKFYDVLKDTRVANTPATGQPSIRGTAQVGETLTAETLAIVDADGLSKAVFTYQWLADDVEISGATNRKYTLVDDDVGQAIKVRVSFTDDAGNQETLTSAVTAAVEPKANSPATGGPTISGTAQVGETLTADTGSISDADGLSNVSFSYQWQGSRDTDIGGATGSTYTLVAADEGKIIKVRVSFTDDAGNEEQLTSAATEAVAAEESQEPPPAPQNLTAAVNPNGSVSLSWEAPDNDSVTGYQILRRRPYEGEKTLLVYVADTGSTATTFTDTDVTAGTQHVYRVKAINNAGLSGWSNYVNVASAQPEPEPDQNTPATGAPVISGTAQVGETLTADTSGIADADGLSGVTFIYQWLSSRDMEIQGATSSAYTLVAADEGKIIKVRVSFTDDAGNAETLTSAATGAVAGATAQGICDRTQQVQDAILANLPDVSDCSAVTADDLRSIEGALRLGTDIAALQAVDFHGLSNLRWLYINDTGLSALPDGVFDDLSNLRQLHLDRNDLSALPDGVFDDLSNLERLDLDHNRLSALPDGVFEGLSSLEWLLLYNNNLSELPDGVFEGLSNLERLYLNSNDLGTLPDGVFEGLYNLNVLGLSFNPEAPFTITAELEQQADYGFVVKIAEGAPFDMEVTLSFQGATQEGAIVTVEGGSVRSLPISVTPSDAGQPRVTVSVESAFFQNYSSYFTDGISYPNYTTGVETGLGDDLILPGESENTPATGAPTISGTAQVGETLTADTSGIADEDGLTGVTFSYQWLGSRDTEIQGATGSTYTLVAADEGKTVKVRVSFSDDVGNEETLTSTATEAVEAAPTPNSPATGAPSITGTAQVGETLTADTSGIADADGLDNATFSYQWLADGTEIDDATGASYTLADADEGKTVTVKVSFTDDAGNEETLTSAATAAVEAAVTEEEPTEPPPAPTNLTAVVNADGSVTLTWDAPDDDSVTGYQVLRRRPYEGESTLLVYVENTGTTATTFTDADVTAGTQHVYRVKAVNAAGVGGQSNYVNVDP